MATADEKAAKQAVRDVARQELVQGQQRLGTIAKATSAYPQRQLRASGDLSRYAIGGFLSDALPPIKPPKVKPPKPAKTRTTAKPPKLPKVAKPTFPNPHKGKARFSVGPGS